MSKEIQLWGASFTFQHLEQRLKGIQGHSWKKVNYQRRAALVSKDGRYLELYTGQDFDPAKGELREHGWTHDHCIVCTWSIGESTDPEHGSGYTDGELWLCLGCAERFLQD